MGLAWVFGGAFGLLCVSALVPVERRVSATFESLLPGAAPEGLLIWLVAVVSAVLFSVRVAAGLARIASKGKGQSAGANAVRAFRLGGRVQVSAFAVWLQIFGMMACATVVLLAPFVLLSGIVQVEVLRPLWVVLDGLGLTFALCYGAALGAVQELAMASLVRHERGTGSAILHAWRLMRNKRLTASRMAVVEMATRVAIVATAWPSASSRACGWGSDSCSSSAPSSAASGARPGPWRSRASEVSKRRPRNRSPTDRGSSASSPPSAPRRRAAGCAQSARAWRERLPPRRTLLVKKDQPAASACDGAGW